MFDDENVTLRIVLIRTSNDYDSFRFVRVMTEIPKCPVQSLPVLRTNRVEKRTKYELVPRPTHVLTKILRTALGFV